jgi:hypothetical protein
LNFLREKGKTHSRFYPTPAFENLEDFLYLVHQVHGIFYFAGGVEDIDPNESKSYHRVTLCPVLTFLIVHLSLPRPVI